MPRTARNNSIATYFHVMCQGINREIIFGQPVDIKYYIRKMYELKEECEITIVAYCVMSNHIHMLLNTQKPKNLSKYMQRLNTIYSIYYNKKYERVGYVFRDRFKAEAINDERYLNNCIKYIYDNPVKAGICIHPSQYKFSNYRMVVADENEYFSFIDTNEHKLIDYGMAIKKYIDKANIAYDEIKSNNYYLSDIIKILKNDLGLSLRNISELLDINREKIRKLYK